MSLFVKEVTCENEFPDIVSVVCVNGSGVLDERDYVPERTCIAEHGLEYDDLLDMWSVHLSCGHIVHPHYNYIPKFCEECGARVDWYGAEVVGHETQNMPDKENTCEGHRSEETGEWICHKCGGSLAGCMFDPVRDGFVDVPNFCPNCGVRVTIGNDTDVPTNEKVVE